MSITIAPMRDYEYAAVFALRNAFPVLQTGAGKFRTGTETPADVQDRITPTVPFVRVNQRSGRTTPTHVYPVLEVDVFSKDRHLSRNLAADIEAWLTEGPHRWVYVDKDDAAHLVLVDSFVTTSSPDRVPWPDATVDRYFASYQISTRRV